MVMNTGQLALKVSAEEGVIMTKPLANRKPFAKNFGEFFYLTLAVSFDKLLLGRAPKWQMTSPAQILASSADCSTDALVTRPKR